LLLTLRSLLVKLSRVLKVALETNCAARESKLYLLVTLHYFLDNPLLFLFVGLLLRLKVFILPFLFLLVEPEGVALQDSLLAGRTAVLAESEDVLKASVVDSVLAGQLDALVADVSFVLAKYTLGAVLHVLPESLEVGFGQVGMERQVLVLLVECQKQLVVFWL